MHAISRICNPSLIHPTLCKNSWEWCNICSDQQMIFSFSVPFFILLFFLSVSSPSFFVVFQSYNPTQAHSRDELLSGKLSYLILPLHCCREKRKISVIRATVASVTPSMLLLLFWTMVSLMHTGGLIPVCAETNTCIHVFLSTHMYSSSHTPAQVLMETQKFHSVWFLAHVGEWCKNRENSAVPFRLHPH